MGRTKNLYLCTFSEINVVNIAEDVIYHFYEDNILGSIFLYDIVEEENACLLTYNVTAPLNNRGRYNIDLPENTLIAHINTNTTTIYTINALNEVIREELGYINKRHKID